MWTDDREYDHGMVGQRNLKRALTDDESWMKPTHTRKANKINLEKSC